MIIQTMLELQDKFNESTIKDWKYKISNEQWKRCIVLEMAEAQESLDWKHWKKGENDWDNFLVEMIDTWHFLMAAYLMDDSYYNINYLWEATAELEFEERNVNQILYNCNKLMQEALNEQAQAPITTFFVIWRMLGYDIEDLYKHYVTKNILNQFRQDNGYKDGTYIKMWKGLDGNMYEDNVIVFDIVSSMKVEELQDNLYNKIEAFYKEL